MLQYYFHGCPSWTWYYPYHYAPCASDLVNLAQMAPRFELGAPLKPIEQLMAVLPPASGHALPAAWAKLMTAEDSPLIELYPIDFEEDLNGAKRLYQAVVLLPFIDTALLAKDAQHP